MARRNKIFLSYRRKDIPGYVRMLEEQLEAEFGDDRVFRDTSDIAGGAAWRQTIEQNMRESAVLLLMIGPHWERIWNERRDDEENYVALELQLAQQYDVKVIPVTVDGTEISRHCELGNIAWIRDAQHHDLSDRQNRWSSDFRGLVRLLEQIDGIGMARSSIERDDPRASHGHGRLRWLAAGAALAVAALLWVGWSYEDANMSAGDLDHLDGPFAAADVPFDDNLDAAAPSDPPPARETPATAVQRDASVAAAPRRAPNVTGTWEGADGTVYLVYEAADGSVEIQSPGYTYGYGMRLPGQPGRFEIEMAGVGMGEFSVSDDGRVITGWIVIDGERVPDRLVRLD